MWPACCAVSAITRTSRWPSVVARRSCGHQGTTAGAVQRQLDEHRVGMRPRVAVEADDVVAGLFSGRPHVGAGHDRIVSHPGQLVRDGPPDAVTQVLRLDSDEVLDQPQDVRTRWGQRAATVVLRESVQAAQRRLSSLLQVVPQVGPRIEPVRDGRHARTVVIARSRPMAATGLDARRSWAGLM